MEVSRQGAGSQRVPSQEIQKIFMWLYIPSVQCLALHSAWLNIRIRQKSTWGVGPPRPGGGGHTPPKQWENPSDPIFSSDSRPKLPFWAFFKQNFVKNAQTTHQNAICWIWGVAKSQFGNKLRTSKGLRSAKKKQWVEVTPGSACGSA